MAEKKRPSSANKQWLSPIKSSDITPHGKRDWPADRMNSRLSDGFGKHEHLVRCCPIGFRECHEEPFDGAELTPTLGA
jgi:hypothetical protein